MSEFYKILKLRNLNFHTGQSIWKYKISDFEFDQPKQRFKIVQRVSELDQRSCTVSPRATTPLNLERIGLVNYYKDNQQ